MRAKVRLVPNSLSQVEGVDYFETIVPTPNTASNRLVAHLACKLNWKFSQFGREGALVQWEVDS